MDEGLAAATIMVVVVLLLPSCSFLELLWVSLGCPGWRGRDMGGRGRGREEACVYHTVGREVSLGPVTALPRRRRPGTGQQLL